jgi:excinuclease UvrABC nuclease subunit
MGAKNNKGRNSVTSLFSVVEFLPERDAEVFASVPAAPAVFSMFGDAGTEPYVSKTANLRRRLLRLLSPPSQNSKRLNLRDRVRAIQFTATGSDFESGLLLYRTLRQVFPLTYSKRLRLRPAALVRLILENEYPRVSVTTRISTLRGRSLYYGPFASRNAAEKFADDALDFFKMRRCTDDLHPDPAFPGCIYSEMKMCLAPCFQGCTDAEYHDEVGRVRDFLDTQGHSLVRVITSQRDQASADLEFEKASATHLRLEKLATVLAQLPEIVRRIDQLDGLIIQPSAVPDSVALFRIERCRLNGPVVFDLQHQSPGQSSKPQSMESRLTAALAALSPLASCAAQETMEQLAYLKRWYFRTSRVGEVFFADENGEFPLRRIVRGISRVFKGEKAGPELRDVAHDYWINRGKAAER